MIKALAPSFLLLAALPALAQDLDFIRAVEDAQRARPGKLSSTARIAPEGEPGTPLIVHGRAFAVDGRTPLAGAVVFAYHTDRNGVYDRPGKPAHSWRLKGWAKTGNDGRFEFRTIRPAPYPGRDTAAHIHLILFTADGARYYAGDVLFEGDPLLSAAQREAARRDPVFSDLRPVRRQGGVEHVDVHRRIAPGEKF